MPICQPLSDVVVRGIRGGKVFSGLRIECRPSEQNGVGEEQRRFVVDGRHWNNAALTDIDGLKIDEASLCARSK